MEQPALGIIGTQLIINNHKDLNAQNATHQNKPALVRVIVGTLCAWKGVDWLFDQPIIYNRSRHSWWASACSLSLGERWSMNDTEDKIMHIASKIGSCGLIALGWHLLNK